MRSFVLVSPHARAGKTMFAAAVASLSGGGLRYVKAIDTTDGSDERVMASLAASASTLARLDHANAERLLAGTAPAVEWPNWTADLEIVEGPSSLTAGSSLGLSAKELAEARDARVIVLARYVGDDVVDELAAARSVFGERLLGVIVNAIPAARHDGAADRFGRFLERSGVPLLGAVPYVPAMEAVSVRELAEQLGGSLPDGAENGDALVEAVMVGTVVLGKASDYFRRRERKAVIAPGHRPDIHLAALETDTRCLILPGNVVPNPIVVARAQEEGVPIILLKADTLTVLEQVDQIFPSARFGSAAKADAAAAVIRAHVDLSAILLAAAVS